jgi:hypothetical protein
MSMINLPSDYVNFIELVERASLFNPLTTTLGGWKKRRGAPPLCAPSLGGTLRLPA